MSGALITIREAWAAFLRGDVPSGAQAYFTPGDFNANDPTTFPINIFTEKLASVDQAIIDAQTKVGLNIVIATVVARGAQSNVRQNGQPVTTYFNHIIAVARVMQNPKVNPCGVAASDCAEAVAYFTRKFSVDGFTIALKDIVLAAHPKALAYDVLYTIEGGTTAAPSRS